MFFCGSKGITAFFPQAIRDNPYVPPVVITSFKIFNDPAPIGPGSELRRAVPYVDSLTIAYRKNVFSLEFAALSYANSHKNRYRYRLESFDRNWTEVGSKQRLATYTNLDPGKYVFRVQGSNSDGIWNEEGVSLPILITPPWYRTNAFIASCVGAAILLLWGLYRLRLYQITREFNAQLEGRVDERLRVARELHDTLLQSFQAILMYLQAARNSFSAGRDGGLVMLDQALDVGAEAMAEGREAIQKMRSLTGAGDLAQSLHTLARELSPHGAVEFRIAVEGSAANLRPDLGSEISRIACEAMRNSLQHAQATVVEAHLTYGKGLRVRIRDNGKGIDPAILSQGRFGHYGIPGMRERATKIGGKLRILSAPGAGTEIELTIPGTIAFQDSGPSGLRRIFRRRANGRKADSARVS
jgi:signal transduction histidine kinase